MTKLMVFVTLALIAYLPFQTPLVGYVSGTSIDVFWYDCPVEAQQQDGEITISINRPGGPSGTYTAVLYWSHQSGNVCYWFENHSVEVGIITIQSGYINLSNGSSQAIADLPQSYKIGSFVYLPSLMR